jgi:hypothetical protein
MTWAKQPAITGTQQPCLHAGVAESLFPADAAIAVGFGSAVLWRDGDCIYNEEPDIDKPDMTGAEAEALAVADPDHDWRIHLMAPLSELEYQRHGPNRWVLIKQGEGFA